MSEYTYIFVNRFCIIAPLSAMSFQIKKYIQNNYIKTTVVEWNSLDFFFTFKWSKGLFKKNKIAS